MAEKIDIIPSERHRKFAAEFVDYVRHKDGSEIISADSFAKMLAIVAKHDADLFFEVTEGINDFKSDKKHKKRTLEDVEKAVDDEVEGAAVKKAKVEGQGRPGHADSARIAQTWLDGDTSDNFPSWKAVVEAMLVKYHGDPEHNKGVGQEAWIVIRNIEKNKWKEGDNIIEKCPKAAPFVGGVAAAKKAGAKKAK